MKEEVIEANVMIADFMGFQRTEKDSGEITFRGKGRGEVIWASALAYHSSWDWLMPVVEKIETFKCLGIDKTYIQINDRSCAIWTYFDVKEFLRMTGDDKNHDGKFKVKYSSRTKISAVWNAVVDFIKWHNEATQKK